MVAKIAVSKSIRRCFFYNENKVSEGVAAWIGVENYPLPKEQLTEGYRLRLLEMQAALNDKTKVNSVHISLNFDPSETFSPEKLMQITKDYMDNLGFGKQPYLVYEHRDAGHPHVHIVTTNIETDGAAISLHRLVNRKSEPARKMLELKYGLIKAEDQNKQKYELQPAFTAKVSYGKSESKKAIANVLSKVISQYRFSTLAGLNAVLGLYNVKADRGSEDSRIYKNHGLVYRILDHTGKPVGVPIKASDFYQKPTLKYLEGRFVANKQASEKYKAGVKNAIDLSFLKNNGLTLEGLNRELRQKGIDTVLHQNQDGVIYGITYVDHKNKCAFNGSELGKQYSSNAIQLRCDAADPQQQLRNGQTLKDEQEGRDNPEKDVAKNSLGNNPQDNMGLSKEDPGLLEVLLQPEHPQEYLPYELRKTRKKRKKRNKKL